MLIISQLKPVITTQTLQEWIKKWELDEWEMEDEEEINFYHR